MFEDPAFPSVPPPPDDGSVRPMSFVGAMLWSVGAHILFLMLAMTVAAVDESSGWDPVTWVICQAATYLLTLFFMLRVHAPDSRIRDFVAMRKTQWLILPLAVVMGLATAFPADWVFAKLQALEPPDEGFFDLLDVFYEMSMAERVTVAVAMAGVGPLVEEMVFRGGIFTATRKRYSARAVIVVSGMLFALVHLSPVKFIPLTIMGMLLGYVRWASGSLLAPLLLHMAFNAVPFYELLRSATRPEEVPTSGTWAAAGAGVTVVALALVHLLSRTRAARAARRGDE